MPDFSNLPAVDDWPATLERLPEDTPDEAGAAYLAELQARLEARYDDPDVQAHVAERSRRP